MRLARLRVFRYNQVHVSQEILSIIENNQFRTSQPRQAQERWWQV